MKKRNSALPLLSGAARCGPHPSDISSTRGDGPAMRRSSVSPSDPPRGSNHPTDRPVHTSPATGTWRNESWASSLTATTPTSSFNGVGAPNHGGQGAPPIHPDVVLRCALVRAPGFYSRDREAFWVERENGWRPAGCGPAHGHPSPESAVACWREHTS